MKLSFSTLGCPDWNLTQAAEKGAEYGYDGIELRIHGDRHVDPSLSKEERQQVKQLFASHGLEIASLAGYTTFCGSDPARLKSNSEALVTNAKLAADLGAPYLRTFVGEDGEFLQAGAEALRKACDQAHELGVTVAMEIHDALKTGAMAAELINTVNSPGLAILWDIHHSLANDETPEETWRNVGKHVCHMHVKDANAAGDSCLVGEGVFPLQEIVDVLRKNKFTGYLSFEWEKTWVRTLEEPEVALPHYLAYMRRLLSK